MSTLGAPGLKSEDSKPQEGAKDLEVATADAILKLSEDVSLQILYKDKHIVVVVKPPGLNTAPGHKLLPDSDGQTAPGEAGSAGLEAGTTGEGPSKVDGQKEEEEGEKGCRCKKRSHQEMWTEAVHEVTTMTGELLPDDKKHLQPHVEMLATRREPVPRKRRVFHSWSRRCLKLEDEAVVDDLFALCQQTFERREGRRMDAVTTRLLRQFKDVKTVHRLDSETSGALVLALTVEAARDLSDQFREKRVEKGYVALVTGGPFQESSGEVNLPMRPDENDRPRQIIDETGGKPCRTTYRLLEHDAMTGHSRVVLTPHTGRTHQLRLHMAAIEHPIVGDTLYHPDVVAQQQQQEGYTPGAVRLHLHAETLVFNHPISQERLSFRTSAPF